MSILTVVSGGSLALLGLALLFTRDGFVISFAIPLLLFAGLLIFSGIRQMRWGSGSKPLLTGGTSVAGLHLTNQVRSAVANSAHSSPPSVTIRRGSAVWVYEESPSWVADFTLGGQPHRYWLAGAGFRFAFGAYERLRRPQLAALESALVSNGSTIHWLLARDAHEPARELGPVAAASPSSVVLAHPDGMAVLAMYSDKVSPEWLGRDQAYTHASTLAWGDHLPMTLTFSFEAIGSVNANVVTERRLDAFADTLMVLTRTLVPQAVVRCAQGFSLVRVYRADDAEGRRIYVHLDGTPPPA
jgi:hypothetical protein